MHPQSPRTGLGYRPDPTMVVVIAEGVTMDVEVGVPLGMAVGVAVKVEVPTTVGVAVG